MTMRIEEHEDGPIEEVLLAPAIVRLVAADLAAEVSSRDFQRHLDGVGARLAEVLTTVPELPSAVRSALLVEVAAEDLAGLDAAVMARIEMAAGAKQVLPKAWVEVLARESEVAPGDLVPAVMGRIEALDEVALDASVARWVRAELEVEPPRDLGAAVMGRIEALEADALAPSIVRALAAESDLGADPSLHAAVMARIERLIEDELASEAPELGAVQRELETEGERMHAARVVSEVEAEVRSIGPRLEREMPRAVLARIAPPEEAEPVRASNPPRPRAEARIGPPLGEARSSAPPADARTGPSLVPPAEPQRGYAPAKAKGRSWMGRGGAAFATILAAAAAVLLYLRPAGMPATTTDPGLTPLHALGPRGEVHVDEIDYDGTVTVTETDGLAVIWLADAPS